MRAIPYGRQEITQQDVQAVSETLVSNYLTQGPKIQEFETAFAAYVGARYAVAVANGTAALHLSALALGVNQNSRVLTTPITFAASANCVRYCQGWVDFVDICPETATIDLDLVEQRLRSSPPGTYQGILPVHFAGYPVDMQRCRELARTHGLWIIEDACHAPGAYFLDRDGAPQMCGNGSYADIGIFSFHPVKHIACGEGGMITTNREDLYRHLLRLRTHGITKDPALIGGGHDGWYYDMVELGFNYRISDIQAALGISQLSRADNGLRRRRELARRYLTAFDGMPVRPVGVDKVEQHAFHLFVVEVESRRELYEFLHSRGIFVQVHYIPLHLLGYYQTLGFRTGDYPKAEAYYERCLSLPMYASLTDDDQDFVIEAVQEGTRILPSKSAR